MIVGKSESVKVIPDTMKAARVSDYSDDATKVLTIEEGVKVPSLEDTPPAGFKDSMLIKVLSVALAPGDVRVMSGKTRELRVHRGDLRTHRVAMSAVSWSRCPKTRSAGSRWAKESLLGS